MEWRFGGWFASWPVTGLLSGLVSGWLLGRLLGAWVCVAIGLLRQATAQALVTRAHAAQMSLRQPQPRILSGLHLR